jgi:hypothetical protein
VTVAPGKLTASNCRIIVIQFKNDNKFENISTFWGYGEEFENSNYTIA